MKNKSQRQLKVAENIKRVISEIFLREGLLQFNSYQITIIKGDVSADIKNAKIFVDIIDLAKKEGNLLTKEENEKLQIIKKLNNSSKFFRHELAKKITLKTVPNISFILDDCTNKVYQIEKLIDEEKQNFDNNL